MPHSPSATLRPVGRFAPSPTGRMHLGNIYSALLSWLSVKTQGGEWILRIEDLDPQRSRMDYALQAEDDLRWLGLQWDRGGTADPDYIQSRRSDVYAHYLQQLQAAGLTYPCYCSRADILATQAPHESDGRVVYKGTCRPENRLSSLSLPSLHSLPFSPSSPSKNSRGGSPATRLRVPDEAIHFLDGHYGPQSVHLAAECGDFIVRRADGAWAYQLAVVIDDALMGVTEVVRGRDLLLSTAQQLYLYRLLFPSYPVPHYAHLPLLINPQGQRLSKRDRSLDMGAIRSQYQPEEVIGRVAYYAGLLPTPDAISLPALLARFSSPSCDLWSLIPTQDIIVS